MPVVADFDTVYTGIEKLFPLVDYLIASANFLPAVSGDQDPFRALQYMARKYGVRAPGMTLGRYGALLYWHQRFYYSPGFVVNTVDTTGAGDVFHGAFIYGLLRGWGVERILDFANAMAGLNCTRLGARGGIRKRAAAERLMGRGERHVNPAFTPRPKLRGRVIPAASAAKQAESPHGLGML